MDEPMVWYEGADISTRRWFHADERGSVIAVSDASGNLVGGINRYDEYQKSVTATIFPPDRPALPSAHYPVIVPWSWIWPGAAMAAASSGDAVA